jgi:hypothetical protein
MKIYTEVSPRTWSFDDGKKSFSEGHPWHDAMLAEIEAGEAEIIAYVEPEPHYADLRRAAYASWGDQLDMQYHDSVDGTTTWVDHVAAVKAEHPKP